MKKRITVVFGVIALGLGGILAYNIVKKYNQNKAVYLKRKSLPNFHFYSQNLKPFTVKALRKNQGVCIFYYNAGCEHCQYEAAQISKEINVFKNTQVVMVSINTPEETAEFARTYKLENAGFIWLYDKEYAFYKWFGKSVSPSVYIYNKAHKLVKEYIGEVKIEAIIKYLDNGKKG